MFDVWAFNKEFMSAFPETGCLEPGFHQWYPKISGCGILMPETRIVHSIDELEQAASDIGSPCFLRTDRLSARFRWSETCFVSDSSKIVENARCIEGIADALESPIEAWIVREIVDATPAFAPFLRGAPVFREFRVVSDGEDILHIQPYWSPLSLGVMRGNFSETWVHTMPFLNRLSDADADALSRIALLAAGNAGEGIWAVDFMLGSDGFWRLIDMDPATDSYLWDPADQKNSIILSRGAYDGLLDDSDDDNTSELRPDLVLDVMNWRVPEYFEDSLWYDAGHGVSYGPS